MDEGLLRLVLGPVIVCGEGFFLVGYHGGLQDLFGDTRFLPIVRFLR